MKKGRRTKVAQAAQDHMRVVWVWLGFGVAALTLIALFVRLSGPEMSAAVVQSQIIALTNDERAANSVGQLTENALLDAAAQAKANDMAANGYFSHTGPDGKTPWQWIAGAGYDYTYAGENLAVRFNDSSQVVSAWMASPTHRANIVKSQYTQIGVGVADGMYQGSPATFVVQYFAAPSVASSEGRGTPARDLSHPAAITSSAPAAPTVAGAEAAPASAAPATPQRSWWQNVELFMASALHSLLASSAELQQAPVVIGQSGISIKR